MSFWRAARAVLSGLNCLRGMGIALAVLLSIGSLVSCSGSARLPQFSSGHKAYVTLPTNGSVLLLKIDGLTGAITLGSQTPSVVGSSPHGLALLANKFLYAANAGANTISIYNVASDGSLTLAATPTPAQGSNPYNMVIDPSGKYLLVTNSSLSDSISVFSIDSGSGALTPVSGSPFFANDTPGEILITTSNFVYVTNPRIGSVTAFTFNPTSACGALCPIAGSPFAADSGANGLATDGSARFLYVANPSAANPGSTTVGNISAFTIGGTGVLQTIAGSPFTSAVGSGPSALVVDPGGRFLFATTPGGNYSIWCFNIDPTTGQLAPSIGSPFSVAAGGLFTIIDPTGPFLYIGSQSAHGVAAYTYDQNSGQPTLVTNSPFSTGTAPGKMILAD
jgi:6-phosphogluconolactonase